jgi:hypothetical protein
MRIFVARVFIVYSSSPVKAEASTDACSSGPREKFPRRLHCFDASMRGSGFNFAPDVALHDASFETDSRRRRSRPQRPDDELRHWRRERDPWTTEWPRTPVESLGEPLIADER